MKIVLISQVCYPVLSPRSQRTTELAKELARQGHDVTIYALLGDLDYSEISNKTNIKFKSLGNSRFGMFDKSEKSNRNIFFRAFKKLFGKYILFPEIELLPMVRRAIKAEGNIDLLITIAVPHVIHYSTAKSNLINVKRWVADCGDPFMGNTFHKRPQYFEKFERRWCERCDYITIPIAEGKDGYYSDYHSKIEIIPQGFNFSEAVLSPYIKNEIPIFAYAGVVYKGMRDPSLFLEYLCTLDFDFKFIVYTKSTDFFLKYKDRLGDKLEIRNYVPREQLLLELSKVDFLINIPNKSAVQQPSKLIDYAIMKRPIINITSDFDDVEKLTFENFVNGDYSGQYIVKDVEQYNIVNIANEFLGLV